MSRASVVELHQARCKWVVTRYQIRMAGSIWYVCADPAPPGGSIKCDNFNMRQISGNSSPYFSICRSADYFILCTWWFDMTTPPWWRYKAMAYYYYYLVYQAPNCIVHTIRKKLNKPQNKLYVLNTRQTRLDITLLAHDEFKWSVVLSS